MAGKRYSSASSLQAFTANPNTAGFFQGRSKTDSIDRDPLVSGYAFVKWLHLPSWVESQYKDFAALTEKNLRTFEGISDIELGTFSANEGFTNSETHYAGGIQRFEGFSMTHREWSGSPIRHAYTHWVTGIRDPATGIARYPKDFGLEYSAKEHTGELIYIMTRPDADNVSSNGVIEFACLYTAVMPTKIPLGHLNFTAGTNDGTELAMTWKGVPNISDEVNKLAAKIHKEQLFAQNSGINFQTMAEYIHPSKRG